MNATKLADGPLLAGRYAHVRELGQGASGRVILAVDRSSGDATRALKVVGPADAARLLWELDVLHRISHPNVARVYELLRSDAPVGGAFRLERGATVLVEEHVDGEPADAAASRLRGAPEKWIPWVLAVGAAAARGLAAVHAAGLVHGDVKPANLVVGDDPSAAQLIDLGLARPPGLSADVVGTPAFLAPEAWQGEHAVATDLYALGATLHELLGGRSALGETRSHSVAELVTRALADPRRAEALPEPVPPALRRLVASLLEPEPDRRPSSAREVVARVVAIASDLGASAEDVRGGGIEDAPSPAERALALSALPLVGREGEQLALVGALGDGGAITVVGPAGAGRSRLVRDAMRALQRARAAAGEPVPTHERARGAVPVALPTHDAVLHVEDADGVALPEARAALRSAAVEGARLTLVLERAAPLEGADAEVRLPPLGRDGVRELLGAALAPARPPDALVDAAMGASGGLPGRLCRLLAEAVASGRDPSRPQTLSQLGAASADAPVPVPEAARDLAEALAVAGGALGVEAVGRAVGGEATDALRVLSAAGLASVAHDGRLQLRADVAHEVRASMDVERRSRLARALIAAPLDAVAAAFVRQATDDPEGARQAFVDAIGTRRAAGDPEGAARLAADAMELLGDRAELAVERADALRARARYADALDVLGEAGGLRAAALRAELHRLRGDRERARVALGAARPPRPTAALEAVAARLALDGGDLSGATEATERALSALDGSAAEAARVREVAALVALYSGSLPEADEHIDRGLRAAREAHDAAAEARITSVAATVAKVRGQVHLAARLYVSAFELADEAGEAHAAASFLVNVGSTRLDAGEPGPAIAALRDGARRLARLDRDQDLARALYNLGLAAVLVGDDDLAASAIRHGREAAERVGDEEARAYATVLQAEIALRAGAFAAARRGVDEAAERVVEGAPRVRAVVSSRRAMVLAALGDREAAAEAAGAAREAAERDGSAVALAEQRVAEARVALLSGDVDTAVLAAREARRHAEDAGAWEPRLRAVLASADAAEAVGDAERARSELGEARALLDGAANTLSPSGRAKLREVPSYRKALSTTPERGLAATADGGRWRRLAFFARRLTAERRVGRLYEEVVDAAVELSGAERGFVVLREQDGRLRVRASRGLGPTAAAAATGGDDAFSRSIAARAIDGGRPVSTVDALRDETMDGVASVHALSLRSVMAVPLRRRGEIAGALYLDDRLRPGAFGPEDVALVADLADLASIALDGAELLRAERRNARRLSVLRRRLARTVETQAIEIASLKRSTGDAAAFPGIVAQSAAMRRALEMVERVASAEVPVLVTGESGTGKELVARAVHDLSARASAPFVSENCGAIPETLLESALFGHVRGAFTGADRTRSGLFEAADGGTLFLDEIGEMSPAMQAKLLRVVQDGQVRAVGSERTRSVDVRLVTATHRDLEEMVARGEFREDLYYRIAVVVVRIPPLRERPEDVAPLVAHFVHEHGEGRDVRFDRRALARLSQYPWPGNVRQLENEVQRALVLGSDVIGEQDLSPAVRGEDPGALDELDLKGQIQALERRLIRQALDEAGGNQTQAAKRLGVSRYGLQKMLKRLDIER